MDWLKGLFLQMDAKNNTERVAWRNEEETLAKGGRLLPAVCLVVPSLFQQVSIVVNTKNDPVRLIT